MIQGDQRGTASPLLITSIVLGVLCAGLIGFGAWAFVNYMDHKNNVDLKVAEAVTAAKKAQSEQDEKDFAEREKSPVRTLVGPGDLGKVTFDYPKTWSVYVDKDGGSGPYVAYLNPGSVNSVSQKLINAVVVSVEDKKYEASLDSYDAVVKKGELKASPVEVGDQQGTKLEGTFSKDVQGVAVLFKLRDKTLKIAVQSNDYVGDFNNIILPSLEFNP